MTEGRKKGEKEVEEVEGEMSFVFFVYVLFVLKEIECGSKAEGDERSTVVIRKLES